MDARSERRVVTALFIDVVGSTDVMMRVGPEVMRRRLSDAFAHMSGRIAQHGGTVENYSGDAIFAIFGAPTARVDDALRALRAARDCVDWSDGASGDERLSVRAGIETGQALVDLDAVARHERMAIGACVTTAARLQQGAGPQEIVVGPVAHDATANVADFEPLGAIELKGLGKIEAWRLEGFVSADNVTKVPFVGREEELRTLSAAADRASRGQQVMAVVVGPPGLGKTRLVDELLKRLSASQSARVIAARCRPAGEEGTNTPLRQLIESEVPNATAEAIADRIARLLGGEAEGDASTKAILHSTGLRPNPEIQVLTRYEQRVNIAEAWRRYLTAVARDQPLIVSVEDLHWADPVFVFMLDHLTESGDAPLLVVGTARPEFADNAHLRPSPTRVLVDLQPLDSDAAASLAEAARGTVAGIDRAAGNPLFIIELARAHTLAASQALPHTIQAAIAARIDELAPDERQLLQQVSVAGEVFDLRDAAVLTDFEPAHIAGMLGRVAHLGFVEPSGRGYRFHHALARDVAYERLPVSQRLELHARYADDGVSASDAVARAFHLWEATRPPDADWAWESAERLRALRETAFDAQLAAGVQLETWNQYEQAEAVYERAVEIAGDDIRRARALAEAGRAAARQGKGDVSWTRRLDAIDAFARSEQEPPARLYADMLEIATMNWGYFHELPADADVIRLLGDGVRVARSSGDDVQLARLFMERAAFTGDVAGTEEVVAFLESHDPAPFADAAHRTAQVLMWAGQFSRSLDIYRRVFDELVPLGAIFNEPEALIWHAVCNFWAGNLATSADIADRAMSDLGKGRSVHATSHVLGLRSLLALGAGDWPGLLAITGEIETLLAENPGDAFCLLGGSAVGFGGAARLLSGIRLPRDLSADAAQMVEASEVVQASSILLPMAILGNVAAVERGLAAYAPGLRLVDRQAVWDVCNVMPAIAGVILERWDIVETPIARLDQCAAGGSRFAAAAAIAVREERDAALSGAPSEHRQLRELGYAGFSELLRYRTHTASPTATAG